MTRINRPDTLLTELRELKRRLGLLEAARARPRVTALTGPAVGAGAPVVPLLPVRPVDWPGTGSPEWEQLLAVELVVPAPGVRVVLDAAADPGTEGAVRVVVDGRPVGEPVPVTAQRSKSTIVVDATAGTEAELAVQARRTGGTGLVRVSALVRSPAG
jgi:hypothetical protein